MHSHVSDAPTSVMPVATAVAGRRDLQALADALQACDEQLCQVVGVIDRLAEETQALTLTPLGRRPWELLARASRRSQAQLLGGARQSIEILRQVTERFAAAIDLLRGLDLEVAPLTFAVAKETVATHLEICRSHLVELGREAGLAAAL